MMTMRGMLEFYPVRHDEDRVMRRRWSCRSPRRSVDGPCIVLSFRVGCASLLLALVVGCATTTAPTVPMPAGGKPTPADVEPPPPNVNLSGFPLPYRQGYADGCASVNGAARKDQSRFAADGNYRTGWQDGFALCKKK
jgi:hypothetical protein